MSSVIITEPLEAHVTITEDSGRIQIVRVGFMGPQGPPGTLIEVEEDGVVEVTPLRNLDFRTGFDISEPVSRTARIDLDLSELSAGGELGGTLDAPTVDASHSGSTHQSITDALNAHEIDAVDAHAASAIDFTPTDTIVSANAQAAIVEALTDGRAYTDNGHVLLSVLRGAINGVAELDADGKVPAIELPALTFGEVFVVASEAAMLALAASPGDIAVRTDTSQTFILSALPASTLANWVELLNPGGDVTSVNGRTGAVTGLEEASNKGALSGYAALDASGYVPDAQINPAIARDTEVSDAITAHEVDLTGAHDASAVSFVPTSQVTATDVQAAIEEIDRELRLYISPLEFGDGTFSQVNVQAAIDYAGDLYDATGDWQTVMCPPGVCDLATRNGSLDVLLFPRSGVTLMGVGDATVFRVADGLMDPLSASGFRVIYSHPSNPSPYDVPLVGARFYDFKVDCNGANNLVTTLNRAKGQVIGVRVGSDIAVARVTVEGNSGRQCFSIGDGTFINGAHSVSNVVIEDFMIHNAGAAIPGNTSQNDHSAIFLQADGFLVRGGRFLQDTPTAVGTAIECHGSRGVVSDHLIDGFGRPLNIVATAGDQRGVTYSHIQVHNSRDAAMFWVKNGYTMRDVKLLASTFEIALDSGLDKLDLDSNIDGSGVCTDIDLDVTIVNTLTTPGANRGAGVILGRIGRVRGHVTGIDLAGPVLRTGTMPSSGFDVDLKVRGIDCGRTTQSAYQYGALMTSNGTFDYLGLDYEFGNTGSTTVAISAITWASLTATVTTAAPHGLVTGQLVQISGADVTGYNTDTATTSNKAVTVINATHFSYGLGVNPGGSATTGTVTVIYMGSGIKANGTITDGHIRAVYSRHLDRELDFDSVSTITSLDLDLRARRAPVFGTDRANKGSRHYDRVTGRMYVQTGEGVGTSWRELATVGTAKPGAVLSRTGGGIAVEQNTSEADRWFGAWKTEANDYEMFPVGGPHVVAALTDGANISVDCRRGNYFPLATDTARTFLAPSHAMAGLVIEIAVENTHATDPITPLWNAVYGFVTVGPTIAAGAMEVVRFVYDGAAWREMARRQPHDDGAIYAADYGVIASGSDESVAVQAAVDAAGPGQRVVLPRGTIDIGSGAVGVQIDENGVVLVGGGESNADPGATILRYTGSGTAVKVGTGGTLRRYTGVCDLTIDTATASAGHVALEVSNARTGTFRNARLRGQAGGGTGLRFTGGIGKTTYYNEFHGMHITADVACIEMGEQINGNRFYGGVLDGDGIAVDIYPASRISSTNEWIGTALVTTNPIIVRLGGNGADVNNNHFLGCRWEPGVQANSNLTSAENGLTVQSQTDLSLTSATSFSTSGYVNVATDNGLIAVAYTGKSGNDLTGCTTHGTGTMATGGAVLQAAAFVVATGSEDNAVAFGSMSSDVAWDMASSNGHNVLMMPGLRTWQIDGANIYAPKATLALRGTTGGVVGITLGAAGSVNLYRETTDVLATDDALHVVGTLTTDAAASMAGLTNSKATAFTSDETSTLTGTNNDVAISADTTVLRWNGASAATFTGFAGGTDGRVLFVCNVATATTLLTLADSTGSTSANQIRCPNSLDLVLRGQSGVVLVYDATSQRWRTVTVVSISAAAGGNITVDSTGATGTANGKAAPADHGHRLDTSSASPSAVGTVAAGTSTTAPSRGDHVHPTGAGTPSTQAFGDAAATGSGPAASMTDHKHGMPAAGAGSFLSIEKWGCC